MIQYALQRGHTVITSDVIDACLAKLMPPGAREHVGRGERWARQCRSAAARNLGPPGGTLWEHGPCWPDQIADLTARARASAHRSWRGAAVSASSRAMVAAV